MTRGASPWRKTHEHRRIFRAADAAALRPLFRHDRLLRGRSGAHQPLREGARLRAEQLDADTLFLLEAAALTHDIGIREAERLYGQCGGKLQERLGPPEAQKMLDSLGFAPDVTERVCFLIAHHHTLDGVDALDWRILLEADFLVNMIEEGMKADAIQCGREKIFRTRMGLRLMERLILKGQC